MTARAKADKYEGYKLHHEVDADAAQVREDCGLVWPKHLAGRSVRGHANIILDLLVTCWMTCRRPMLLGSARNRTGSCRNSHVLRDAFRDPMTNMTLLHYPPQAPDEGGYGIHPHKDTDALTIIAPDPVGGLEVQTRDRRMDYSGLSAWRVRCEYR